MNLWISPLWTENMKQAENRTPSSRSEGWAPQMSPPWMIGVAIILLAAAACVSMLRIASHTKEAIILMTVLSTVYLVAVWLFPQGLLQNTAKIGENDSDRKRYRFAGIAAILTFVLLSSLGFVSYHSGSASRNRQLEGKVQTLQTSLDALSGVSAFLDSMKHDSEWISFPEWMNANNHMIKNQLEGSELDYLVKQFLFSAHYEGYKKNKAEDVCVQTIYLVGESTNNVESPGKRKVVKLQRITGKKPPGADGKTDLYFIAATASEEGKVRTLVYENLRGKPRMLNPEELNRGNWISGNTDLDIDYFVVALYDTNFPDEGTHFRHSVAKYRRGHAIVEVHQLLGLPDKPTGTLLWEMKPGLPADDVSLRFKKLELKKVPESDPWLWSDTEGFKAGWEDWLVYLDSRRTTGDENEMQLLQDALSRMSGWYSNSEDEVALANFADFLENGTEGLPKERCIDPGILRVKNPCVMVFSW